jgi:hypothetical protein
MFGAPRSRLCLDESAMDRRHDRRHLFDGISNAEFRFLIEKNADGIVVRIGTALSSSPIRP